MINNARAESDARSARGGEGPLPGQGTSDFGEDVGKRIGRLGDSDGEGSGYEDDYEGLSPRTTGQRRMTERESI